MFGVSPQLVNKRHTDVFDVYIGRPSLWENPKPLDAEGSERSREEALAYYEVWIERCVMSGRITLDDLLALRGKKLACWCVPKKCHGHTIIRWVLWAHQLDLKYRRMVEVRKNVKLRRRNKLRGKEDQRKFKGVSTKCNKRTSRSGKNARKPS